MPVGIESLGKLCGCLPKTHFSFFIDNGTTVLVAMFPVMDESYVIKTHHAIAVHLALIDLEMGNITQFWTRRYKEKSAGSGSRNIFLA